MAANKGIGIIKKIRPFVPQSSLLIVYKSYVRSLLDYADIIYDQPFNELFTETVEAVQYNSALAITGAIRGTSKQKIYQELGLESLADRRWLHRLCLFYKIKNGLSPAYLDKYMPTILDGPYRTRTRPALKIFLILLRVLFIPTVPISGTILILKYRTLHP